MGKEQYKQTLTLQGFDRESIDVLQNLYKSRYPDNLISWLQSQVNHDQTLATICDKLRVYELPDKLTESQANRLIADFQKGKNDQSENCTLKTVYNMMCQEDSSKDVNYWNN